MFMCLESLKVNIFSAFPNRHSHKVYTVEEIEKKYEAFKVNCTGKIITKKEYVIIC